VPARPSSVNRPVVEPVLRVASRRVIFHPLGCRQPRIPDRVVFGKLDQALMFGRPTTGSPTQAALRARSAPADEWITAGVFDPLQQLGLEADDRFIGLHLTDLSLDGCNQGAYGGDVAGKSLGSRRWTGATTERHCLVAHAFRLKLIGVSRTMDDKTRERRLLGYWREDIQFFKQHGYGAGYFRQMLARHGAVETARRLLAGPLPQSGFTTLWEIGPPPWGQLERSVEFTVLLPWFRTLFSQEELDEAERRLVLYEFPVQQRLAARSATPPAWVDDD